jgi:hypothetical protein
MQSEDSFNQSMTSEFLGCAAVPGDTLAQKLSTGGRAYYDCGAALFHLASRLKTSAPRATGVMDLWAAIFAGSSGSAAYDLHTFTGGLQQFLGRQDDAATTGERMLRAIVESQVPWNKGIGEAASAFRMRPPEERDIENAAFARNLLDAIVIGAVRDDCHGATSIGYENQTYDVERLPTCDRITASIKFTSLQGHSMNTEPSAAAGAALAACTAGEDLLLADAAGQSVSLRCSGSPIAKMQAWLPVESAK